MQKKIFLPFLAAAFLLSACGSTVNSQRAGEKAAAQKGPVAAVSFDINRMSTMASNQIAVWVENTQGQTVKTLYVSNFTGKNRGYTRRDMSLNHWVKAARPADMTDKELDSVSSATPKTGKQTYTWDLTDSKGNPVPKGIYTIKAEGTLYWTSNVVYSGKIDIANLQKGPVTVTMQRSEPNNKENETMLQNVEINIQ